MINSNDTALYELNRVLCENNINLSIICVGGYVLNYYGIRNTEDIDAFYDETPIVKTLIRQIGEKFNLNTADEYWLNNSVQNLNEAPPVKICKPIKTFSNLQLIAPPLEYIAGMKLVSGRERDIKDVAAILVRLEIDNLEKFRKTLNKFNFRSIDDSLLLEAFGIAYGMDWLERYYDENEDDIVKLIDQNSSDYYDNSLRTKQTSKGKRNKSTQSAR